MSPVFIFLTLKTFHSGLAVITLLSGTDVCYQNFIRVGGLRIRSFLRLNYWL